VKLLFDQNLSHNLVALLSDVFPGSAHVRAVGLGQGTDAEVWAHAREHDFVLVSKDEDFHQMSFLLGPPPQVVWVRLGNCSTRDVE
jgi:predicted nuclease of predicted toxin-antitoxin system